MIHFRDIIARTPMGHIVTEDADLVRAARRAIRRRWDDEGAVMIGADRALALRAKPVSRLGATRFDHGDELNSAIASNTADVKDAA